MTVHEMKEARGRPTVLFHKYLNSRKDNKFICFWEGDTDRYYYINIIADVLKEKFLTFPCMGKDNLLKLMELTENEKKETNKNIELMFIMDGDYLNKEKYKNEQTKYLPDFHILNVYSFENYYCSLNCIRKILIREFGVEQDSDVLLELMNDFNNLVEASKSAFKVLNKCFYIIRELRNIDHKVVKFDNLEAVRYQSKTNEIEVEKLTFQSIAETYDLDDFSDDELSCAADFFDKKEMNLVGRGHNQIKLVSYFFQQLYKKNKENKLVIRGKNIKLSCKVDIGKEIVEHCSYAADKPDDLIKFIDVHIRK